MFVLFIKSKKYELDLSLRKQTKFDIINKTKIKKFKVIHSLVSFIPKT